MNLSNEVICRLWTELWFVPRDPCYHSCWRFKQEVVVYCMPRTMRRTKDPLPQRPLPHRSALASRAFLSTWTTYPCDLCGQKSVPFRPPSLVMGWLMSADRVTELWNSLHQNERSWGRLAAMLATGNLFSSGRENHMQSSRISHSGRSRYIAISKILCAEGPCNYRTLQWARAAHSPRRLSMHAFVYGLLQRHDMIRRYMSPSSREKGCWKYIAYPSEIASNIWTVCKCSSAKYTETI